MTSNLTDDDDDAFDDLVYRTTPGAPTAVDNTAIDKPNRALQSRTSSYLSRSKGSTAKVKIPPKIVVKFFIHEEVSSIQELQKPNIDQISCHVNLEGTIHAQIISSDAIKNPPFAIRLCDPDYPEDNYQFDTNFMTYYGSGEFNTLNIPKAILGQIKIATYQRTVTKKFMPVLVQSK